MAKKVKLPLDMGNDVFVRTLDELKENYNTEKVTESFLDGRLLTWLNDRYYEDEAAKVRELSEQGDRDNLAVKLGEIFGVKVETEVDIDVLEIRREKLEKLRKITSDDNILANADSAAFSQEDLGDLLDEGAEVIYLCGGSFRIPMSVKNIRYIGVGNPVVSIGGNGEIDLEANGICFENCEFAADTRGRIKANAGSKTSQKIQDENTEFTDDKYFEFAKTKDGILLKKYTGNHKIVKIPEIVTAIDDHAFYSSFNSEIRRSGQGRSRRGISDAITSENEMEIINPDIVEEIIIPDSVKVIGHQAFAGRNKLKNINLPDSIMNIDYGLFENCEGLQDIILPSNLKVIEAYAFCGCKSLKYITLPNSMEVIECGAFCDCQSLEEITIPDGVTEIENNTFKGCTNLKKVFLPKSLKYLFVPDPKGIVCTLPPLPVPPKKGTILFWDDLDYDDKEYKAKKKIYDIKVRESKGLRTAKGVFDDCPNVVVEYNGKTYKHGQLKSLYLQFQ